MSELIGPWLECAKWDPQQLIDWLQGYDLPAVGHEDEPFLWLLRGLPTGSERYHAECRFAERVAHLLEADIDLRSSGSRPTQVLYNLFMLAAGLGCPDQLGAALQRTLERQRERRDEWFDLDVRDAFRAALIENQLDSRFYSIWDAMLTGEGDDFLPGNAYDGYDGILRMPPSYTARGKPALEAIGRAQYCMSQHLKHEHDRRPEFRRLIARALQTYPGRPTWEIDLLNQADQHRWPGWAVECLPSLYIRSGKTADGPQTAYVWHYICACVPEEYDYEIHSELCGGLVFDLKVTADTGEFLRSIAPRFEFLRLRNPFPSDRSTVGVALGAMSDLELVAKYEGDLRAADALATVRRRVLPNLDSIGVAAMKVAETLQVDDDREAVFISFLEAMVKLYPKRTTWNADLSRLANEKHWPDWATECLPLQGVA